MSRVSVCEGRRATPSTPFTPLGEASVGLTAVPAAAKRRTRSLLRHPLLETAVASGDRTGDFEAFAAALLADLAPVGAAQAVLAARIVGLAWRLNRAQALESAFLSKPDDYGEQETPIENCLDKLSDRQALESLQRWEGGLQRNLLAAMSAFRGLQNPSSDVTTPVSAAAASPGMLQMSRDGA
jgi:hypothetical protein